MESPDIPRRLKWTHNAIYFYRPETTWAVVYRGLKWYWLPSLSPGLGYGGRSFHWLGVMFERVCHGGDRDKTYTALLRVVEHLMQDADESRGRTGSHEER